MKSLEKMVYRESEPFHWSSMETVETYQNFEKFLNKANDWKSTRQLLHAYIQIVGKIKLRLHPKLNHWWHATLSVSPVGWTTGLIPYDHNCFEMEFNFISHQLVIKKSDGHFRMVSLDQYSIKSFHDELFACLHALNIDVAIDEHPYDISKIKLDTPFNEDNTPIEYDSSFAHQLWQSYMEADVAFQKFKGRFIGKSSPVQLFWHSFDLALTFFSGRPAPLNESMDKVSKEAYSHEVISFGYWAGDDDIPEPSFYSYVYPEPSHLEDGELRPREAYWKVLPRGKLAVLPYKALSNHMPRENAILDFMESAFANGIERAKWTGETAKLLTIDEHRHHFTTH